MQSELANPSEEGRGIGTRAAEKCDFKRSPRILFRTANLLACNSRKDIDSEVLRVKETNKDGVS